MTGDLTAEIADIIGYDKLAELCESAGGAYWYIPKSPPPDLRDRRIRETFDNLMQVKQYPSTMKTYRAVAQRYGVSVSTVRRVVSAQSWLVV